jgi:hypothetical protein
MRPPRLRFTSYVLLLTLTACSINLSEATQPPPTLPATVVPATAALTAEALPTEAPTSNAPEWAVLNLSGQLVFTQPKFGLSQLDLTTGALTTRWALPENGWLTAAALAPQGDQFLLAYGPPPPAGLPQLGYTDLYLLPAEAAEAAEPQPLLTRALLQESFFNPLWSPDGQWIYYTHFTSNPPPAETPAPGTPAPAPFVYAIERKPMPAGDAEVLVLNAFWPALSPDGAHLAYVTFDPTTSANDLFIANADGTDPRPVLVPGTFEAVDAPLFTPDGQAILFSAVGEGPTSLLDNLLGVSAVFAASSAHNVPSDWWRVDITGQNLTRLTRMYDTGLFGAYAADGRYLAFMSGTGLWAMAADGGEVIPLVGLATFGTLEWAPE